MTESVVDPNPPANPWMKEVADIDGDGQIDLIVAGRDGPLVWYRYPDWTRRTIANEIGEGGAATGMDAVDIDMDGDVDIALASGRIFENPGAAAALDGRAWRQRVIDDTRAHDIFMVDLDNDGDIDAVKRGQGANGAVIRLFRRDGADAWSPRALDAPSGEGLGVADLDGDGDLDLIISGRWYENSGDILGGAWTEHTYAADYREPDVVVATGDINGDGRLDIVLSPAERAGERASLAWFEGGANARELFVKHAISDREESVVHGLQLGDFDGDGALDVAVAEMNQGRDPDNVTLFLNREGAASWVAQVISTEGSHNIRAADIGADGDLDLFGANWNTSEAPDGASVKLWVNGLDRRAGADWRRHVIDDERPWRAMFVMSGDIDGDGLKDVAAGGFWYRNPGAAGSAWPRSAFGGALRNIAILADMNGDGRLDALGTAGRGSAPNAIFSFGENAGGGRFIVRDGVAAGNGDFLQGAVLADFGAGAPQVALSWHEPGRGVQMLTIPADPARDPWPLTMVSGLSQDEQLSAGDIDRDGRVDLLLGTRWLRNSPDGWVPYTLFSTAERPDRNRLADINGDGRLDAIVGYEGISERRVVAWYEQPLDAARDWSEHRIGFLIGPMSLDAADYDRDGDIDVLVGEHNLNNPEQAGLYVFENPGAGAGDWTRRLIHIGDEHHNGAHVADMDGDGDLDVISLGWGGDDVVWYERVGRGAPP